MFRKRSLSELPLSVSHLFAKTLSCNCKPLLGQVRYRGEGFRIMYGQRRKNFPVDCNAGLMEP